MGKLLLLSVVMGVASFAMSAENGLNPFGVCAHLTRWEYPQAESELKMIKEAGIGAYRTDFDWSGVEPQTGEWNFTDRDRLVDMANEVGVESLMIIPGGVPLWASPFPNHIDKVAEACGKIAAHFKGRVKYWEVVNEPDLTNFWGKLPPDPIRYAELLKKVYAAVKKADPNALVLYAGVSGFPKKYVEATFKENIGDFFDIMNFHPYNWSGFQEGKLDERICELRDMMKKYGLEKKPIWITEFGYTSATVAPCVSKYIRKSLELLEIDTKKCGIAFISDVKYGQFADLFFGTCKSVFPDRKMKGIEYEKLAKLSVKKYPVLFIPQNETFPYEFLDALNSYVANGGTAVSLSGLPFYHDISISPSGVPSRKAVGRKTMRIFGLSCKTANDADMEWVKPMLTSRRSYKNIVPKLESAKGFEEIEPDMLHCKPYFVSTDALGDRGEFVPFCNAVLGDKRLPIGGIFKFTGDVKGNIIVFFPPCDAANTEEFQATMIPREFIIARAQGVERVFKYCFRDNERDYSRESHFGIIRKNLEPKPAYLAYKTLTKNLGKSVPKIESRDGVYIANWTRGDGERVCAVWTLMKKIKVSLEMSGEVKTAENFLGASQKYWSSDGVLRLAACGEVAYFVGCNVSFRKR